MIFEISVHDDVTLELSLIVVKSDSDITYCGYEATRSAKQISIAKTYKLRRVRFENVVYDLYVNPANHHLILHRVRDDRFEIITKLIDFNDTEMIYQCIIKKFIIAEQQ